MTVAAGRGVGEVAVIREAESTCDRGVRLRYAANAMEAGSVTKQLWMCTSCGFIYDPDEGDPDGGIPPGTAFDEIPDTWFCPVCGARKADFEPYE
jgi:rubredoxin